MATNRKGGQFYPLVDSRLKVTVVDHGETKASILKKLLRIPRADLLFATDDSRTTLVLSLLLRARRKTGWIQGISRLYAENGFFEWHSVQPRISTLVKWVFRPGKIRRPEDKHDAEVELELLDLSSEHKPLAAYRSSYAAPKSSQGAKPYIYCAAEA